MVKITPRVAPPLEVGGAVGRSRDTQKTPWGVVGRSRDTRVAGHRRTRRSGRRSGLGTGASAAYHRSRRTRTRRRHNTSQEPARMLQTPHTLWRCSAGLLLRWHDGGSSHRHCCVNDRQRHSSLLSFQGDLRRESSRYHHQDHNMPNQRIFRLRSWSAQKQWIGSARSRSSLR